MKVDEVMRELEALGSEEVRAMNLRNGSSENQFGLKKGDIRVIAKKIKFDAALARELWATENVDARFLATLILRPKDVSAEELEAMVRSVEFSHLADWLNSYIVKSHPEKEALRQKWMTSSHPATGRAAWSLTAERVAKNPEGLDLVGLLDRIESELLTAPELVQWTMNMTLAEIGIQFAEHRERALEIGEKLGVYRDYPCSKGCTSPFAPIWINEMVSRSQAK